MNDKKKEKGTPFPLIACALALVAAGFVGYSIGFQHGATFTYNSIYILFTNAVNEAATSLDCHSNTTTIEITKRPAPMKCCYPLNCPQAKNNPKICECEYTIYCFGGINYE